MRLRLQQPQPLVPLLVVVFIIITKVALVISAGTNATIITVLAKEPPAKAQLPLPQLHSKPKVLTKVKN